MSEPTRASLEAQAASALTQARAAFARGEFERTFVLAGEVLAATPASGEAKLLRLNAALQSQRWPDAIAMLGVFLRDQPGQPKLVEMLAMAWTRLGNRERDVGHLDAAREAYQSAMSVSPQAFDARYNLALLALDAREHARAVELLTPLTTARPQDAEARLQLARALVGVARETDAVALLLPIARDRSAADRAGIALRELIDAGRSDLALDAAIALYADRPDDGIAFAARLRNDGDLESANRLLDALAPRADGALRLRIDIARKLGLQAVYESADEVRSARERYAVALDALIADYPPERIANIAPALDAFAWENFYLAYQGGADAPLDDRTLQARYGRWLVDSVRAALPSFAPMKTPAARTRKRILFISSFFRDCTIGAYFQSWTKALREGGFEVVVAHLDGRRDEVTRAFEADADHFLQLTTPLPQIATTLREIEADIALFPEIGMDGRIVALAALGLAPRQIAAWGHPITTGLPTIDAYLTCGEMEPPDANDHYTERLVALSGIGTRYASPRVPAPATRASLGLPDDAHLYLCPQSPYKLHPDNDAVLAEIVRRDSRAVIVLFAGVGRAAAAKLRTRLLRALSAVSTTPERHLHVQPMTGRERYLAINLACDVMVDTLHWSGGNTTLDALHGGLPVVTCPGRFMRGRQSAAMLERLGCGDLVVATPAQLAERAVAIASRAPRREALSRSIRARLPELVDDPAPLAALVLALRA